MSKNKLTKVLALYMTQRILGISRALQYSPHSQDRDAAIFAAVTARLERSGHKIDVISEDLLSITDLTDYDLVFSMARGRDVLSILAKAEKAQGLKVINSATSLLQLTRAHIITLLNQHHLSLPATCLCHVALHDNPSPPNGIYYPFWMKRVDACAQQAGDVQLIHSRTEYVKALVDFNQRGITHYVAEQHIEGDLVKFYGVEGTPFFHYSYPTEGVTFSKFGLEQANGTPSHYSFNIENLKQAADEAAKVTGMIVYGGDAVITAQGSYFLIDFNDWPSFSACRRDAAKAIAQRIQSLI